MLLRQFLLHLFLFNSIFVTISTFIFYNNYLNLLLAMQSCSRNRSGKPATGMYAYRRRSVYQQSKLTMHWMTTCVVLVARRLLVSFATFHLLVRTDFCCQSPQVGQVWGTTGEICLFFGRNNLDKVVAMALLGRPYINDLSMVAMSDGQTDRQTDWQN